MSLGKLFCMVNNLHIGALKEFGHNSAMLDARGILAPAFIEVDDEELLNHPQIKSAIGAGVLVFKCEEGEGLTEDLTDQSEEVLETTSSDSSVDNIVPVESIEDSTIIEKPEQYVGINQTPESNLIEEQPKKRGRKKKDS